MSVYTIADLHLSELTNKPMDKFGHRWTDHTEKLKKRWAAVIDKNDTVVIPGDVSWGMSLEEAAEDFRLIDSLPGKKLIGKGNHDFWWTTASKMKRFLADIGVTSIDFLHNNAFYESGVIIAGSRGWYIDEKLQNTQNPTDYSKLVAREAERLEISLSAAEALRKQNDLAKDAQIKVFMHFPPVFSEFKAEEIVAVLKRHNVGQCFFGHIHGKYSIPQRTVHDGIKFTLISADYLDFYPEKVF